MDEPLIVFDQMGIKVYIVFSKHCHLKLYHEFRHNNMINVFNVVRSEHL